jgi:hypothetical protein
MNRILATVLLVQIVLLSYETLFYHFLSTISGLTRFQISHCVPKFSWVFLHSGDKTYTHFRFTRQRIVDQQTYQQTMQFLFLYFALLFAG